MQKIRSLAEQIAKEIVEADDPSIHVCRDLVEALIKEGGPDSITYEILEETNIGKLLTKSIKSFKRHKRTSNDDDMKGWESIIDDASKLLQQWKAKVEEIQTNARSKEKKIPIHSMEPGLPRTVGEYRTRLVIQKKEIYKDPPVLPPIPIKIHKEKFPLPKRDEKTGLLTFTSNDPDIQQMLKDFHPNRTPEEVLRAGSFGGTYFRPITSAVTNISYNAKDVLKDTVDDAWIKDLPLNMLTSNTYRPQINKFGVKCGGSLGMWESSGWIVESDPYGWFQWYCRFFKGRRSSDDARQISRWMNSAGPKGRFRSQLCNKIIAAGVSHTDKSISPVIRQTLLHWGLEVTEDVLQKHRKRVGC